MGYFYQAVSFGDNMIGILDALSSNLTSYLDFSPDTEILSDNIGNHLLTFTRRLFSIHAGALEQNIYVIRTKFIPRVCKCYIHMKTLREKTSRLSCKMEVGFTRSLFR